MVVADDAGTQARNLRECVECLWKRATPGRRGRAEHTRLTAFGSRDLVCVVCLCVV